MANTYTVSGSARDLASAPLAVIKQVFAVTNLDSGEALIDLTNLQIHMGGKAADVDADGNFSVSLIATNAGDLNVLANTVQYQVHINYIDPATRAERWWSSGWFFLTANTNVATVATNASPVVVATASKYAQEAKDARDQAVSIAGIATTDAAVKAALDLPNSASAGYVAAAVRQGDKGRSGRGMVSITFDDALLVHFTSILPISKAMGFACGTAWVTGNGRTAEVTQAYQAGWEIISHTVAHQNMTTFTEAQLIADAEACVTAISAITGRTDNIGFVYPVHNRNANTDRVLSRYYTWGRGIATPSQGAAGGHPWLVSSHIFDDQYDASGNLSENLKGDLRTAARNNGRLSLYSHYTNETTNPGGLTALVNLVNYVRSLGMEIVTPSVLRGAQEITPRRTPSTTGWTLGSRWSVDSGVNIRAGEPSFKFTPNATGGGFGSSTLNLTRAQPIYPEAGKFLVCRASFRYKVANPVTISSGWGFELGASCQSRPVDGGNPVSLGAGYLDTKFPTSGTSIPAADWGLVSRVMAFGPDITGVFPFLQLNNVAEAQDPINAVEYKFDWLDSVTALSYVATLNGTTGVNVVTDVIHISRYAITIAPLAATAGTLYYEIPTATDSTVRVKSTNVADTTQQVRVTVMPLGSYNNYTLATDGA